MVVSSHKGAAFENAIAKQLSLWLTDGADRTQLIRSQASGGWVGRRLSVVDGWRQIGDLSPNGVQGEQFRSYFSVETKHHASVDFWHLLTGAKATTADWLNWWPQVVGECRNPGNCEIEPLLVFMANRKVISVGIREALMQRVGSLLVVPSMLFQFGPHLPSMRVFTFKQFLAYPPEFWYNAISNLRLEETTPW